MYLPVPVYAPKEITYCVQVVVRAMEVTTVKLAGSWGLDITPIGKVYPVPPALSQTLILRVFTGIVLATGGAIRKRLAFASVELNNATQFGALCGVVVTVRT